MSSKATTEVGRLGERARTGIRGLQPYQPGKPVAALERELGIAHALKLASNENPLGPSARAITAIQAAAAEQHIYPDGAAFALRQALAHRVGVDPFEITLGNGSNEILELIGRVWLGEGTKAVFSAHAFAVYPLVTKACGAEAVVVPALPADDATQPFGHDLAAMADAIDDSTRVVFLANPNNPTGTWFDADALDTFLTRVPADVAVVLDEAYCEYVTEPTYPNGVERLSRHPNVIVTRTFSKIFGLAGLRLGYAVSSPEVADLLNRARQPFNVNALAQAGGLAALGDDEHVSRSVSVNQAGLEQISSALRVRGHFVLPSVGNFVAFHCSRAGQGGAAQERPTMAQEMYEALLREGVILRPIENYGLSGFLRVTVSTESDNAVFLQALDRVSASMMRPSAVLGEDAAAPDVLTST